MGRLRYKFIVITVLGFLILFGCDSGDHLVDKGKPSVVEAMRSNPGSDSSVDSSYLDASTAVHLDPNYTYSYQRGGSPTISTHANPATATATATDAQDIHIYPSSNQQSEVHISVSLANPDNLLVSANTTIIGNSFQGYYYSNDSGTNWQGSDRMPNNAPSRGDPTTAFDAVGNGYLGTMGPNAQTNPAQSYLIQKTTNGGLTWQPQVRGFGPVANFDKEMIAADNISSSPYANNLYAAWSIHPGSHPDAKVQFNRSTDGGQTFSNAITLKNGWGQGANVQTGPNGNVYVCWANYGTNDNPANGIGFARSSNGGVSFGLNDIAFSYDGIRTTLGGNPAFGGTRVNDFPSMAVDKSGGSYDGRIYIAYPEEVSGKAVIRVRSSGDQGNSWSSAKTISIGSAQQSWFPWIAVDQQKGWVSVDYYVIDGSNYQTDTYLATSFDGGQTWYNTKVSDMNHTTAPIPGFLGGYAGDYIGLAAYGGKAYPTWMDDRNNSIWQIYVSPVTLTKPPPFSVQIDGLNSALQGQERTYTSEVSGGQSPYSYEWYYYDDSDNPLATKQQTKLKSGFHDYTFTHTALNPSYDYIYLFVTDSNGGTVEATKRIYVF